jgi:hypothetical protein
LWIKKVKRAGDTVCKVNKQERTSNERKNQRALERQKAVKRARRISKGRPEDVFEMDKDSEEEKKRRDGRGGDSKIIRRATGEERAERIARAHTHIHTHISANTQRLIAKREQQPAFRLGAQADGCFFFFLCFLANKKRVE